MKKSEKFVIYTTLCLALALFVWSVFFIADIEGAFGRPWVDVSFLRKVYSVGTATSFLLASLLLPFKRRTGRWFALPGLVAVGAFHVYGSVTSSAAPWTAGRPASLTVSALAVAFAAVAIIFLFVVGPRYERRRTLKRSNPVLSERESFS